MFRGSTTMKQSHVNRNFLWILFWASSCLAFSAFLGVDGTINYSAHGLCPSMYIRNEVRDLQRLEGCRVIEGNLQISLIDTGPPAEYRNYTFPQLREVTGYFLLTWAAGLQTLSNLFPNLAVIRGQDLIYNYAFIISDMQGMHEIGLPSLTNIMQRGVYIAENPNLCYVDTIDWARITNDSSVNHIQKNKPSEQCPNICPPNICPKAESDTRDLCWSNTDCQIIHKEKCPGCGGRPCTLEGECCDEQCLGGCDSPNSPSNCHVCKNVEILQEAPRKSVCRAHCPESTYEYLNRRCVTEDECRSIVYSDPKRKGLKVKGKLLNGFHGKDVCVLECPKSYTLIVDADSETCQPCDGPCKKVCPGTFVDSVESSAILKGCTTVNGTLKIQIRGYAPHLVKELENNLDMIEDIDGSLVVANSHSLSSLNFLKALKRIHGNILEENSYAVVVKSNENIQALWNRTESSSVHILRPDARVLFHYNPKLCPGVIHNFVRQTTINSATDTNSTIDIGVTNGDKVPCNKTELALEIKKRTNSSVTIQWENFRRNLTDARYLLNYEVYYKVSPDQMASLYEDRDPCGGDDWKVVDVAKMSFSGSRESEPQWQAESLITGLLFYTQYAIYVKTVVIPDRDSPNHNMAAQSRIHYFTTLPGIPTSPRTLSLVSNSSQGIVISWFPPETPNGVVEKYQIYLKEEWKDAAFQDQRDYCKGRPDIKPVSKEKTTPSFVQTLQEINDGKIDGRDCCSCSANPVQRKTTPPPLADRENSALFERQVQDAITNAIFIENPDYKEKDENENIKEDIVSSIISTRRRRRSIETINELSSTTEDSKEVGNSVKTFPDAVLVNEHMPLKHTDMNLVIEVWANQTSSTGRNIYFLSNLTHFTRYTIGIMACRAVSIDIMNEMRANDTRTCSPLVKETLTTLPSETADYVDVRSIVINVTGNEIKLSWDEPMKANGIAMSYNINVTRVDTSKTNEPSHIACITRKLFNESGRNYTFPKVLHPGNYSIRIQVISLAPQLANYTAPKYFIILASEEGMSAGQILAIVLPILIFFFMAAAFFLYFLKTRKLVKKITSANPEYLQNVDIPEEFEVPRDKIELIKELGKGSFGMVYEGIVRDFKGQSKVKCAIKQVAKGAPSEDRYRFLQEANIMTQMDCHHVVRLLGVVSLSQPTFVIMELMAHGDLKNYLRQRRPDAAESNGEPPPTLKQILRMAVGIADGMAYLDSKGFVHRDLAARNCMVAEDLTVKVGDFGMTKDTDYYRKSTRGLLPVRWMAPESIKDGIFTIQSDLWSFGVVLWEMATLAVQPYQGLNNDQVLRYVREGGIMERPENCPDILYDMMLRCWAYRVPDRPTFVDILDWLVAEVDPGFAKVSFYHSPSGTEYRAKHKMRPTHEEQQATAKTPLRATFEDDLISEDEANNSDEDEDPTLLRHGEDIHGNEIIPTNRRPPNVNSALFPAADLPSAFQNTSPPSSVPSNNNNRPETSIDQLASLEVPLLNNRPMETNRNNRTDQIQLIPPPPNSNRSPIGGNYSNEPSTGSLSSMIQFSPAAGGSVNLSMSNGPPLTNPKSELNRFQSQKPLNGLLSPINSKLIPTINSNLGIKKNKSTTEF